MDTLAAALEYAAVGGYHVFPLKPGTKLPATAHGLHDATNDQVAVQRLFKAAGKQAGIGLACEPSGLFVVDVDPRSELGSAKQAQLALGLPPTTLVSTPSGGWHFYFRGSGPSTVDKLRHGVDTRGVGGYVVAPPTPGYTPVRDVDPAPVPPALLEALRRPPRVEAHTTEAFDRAGVLEGVPEGRRQDSLFRYACSLRARGVEEAEAQILVCHAADRCVPPFEAVEALTIVDRVFGVYDGPETLEEVTEPLLMPLSSFDGEDVAWFWYPRIPLGKLTVIAGVQGHGKSYVTAALTAAATTGTALPMTVGNAPPAGDVILASYEDGIGDTVRRRMDNCGADLTKVHILPTGQDRRRRRAFRLTDLPKLEAAMEEIPDRRLLIIDPITSLMGGTIDNNSNEAVRAALEPLTALATQFGVAVLAIAHLNKTQIENALYRVSGANAFTALPRSVLLVEHDEKAGQRRIKQIKNNLDAKADPVIFEIGRDGLKWRFGQ